jgi:hypothetical protein
MEKPTLRELISAGAVQSVTAQGVPDGYLLVVATEAGPRVVVAQRGHSRVFKRLDAVAAFVKDVGLGHFYVDLSTRAQHRLV